MEHPREIWVGTYTADFTGTRVGIGALRLNEEPANGEVGSDRARWQGWAMDTPSPTPTAPSPSFLAVHPSLPVIYAVAEQTQAIAAYTRVADICDTPRLEPLGNAWPAGEAVCHVAVDPLGHFLTVTCWGDGSVLLYELDDRGAVVSRFESESAVDPYAEKVRAEIDTAGMLERTGFSPRTSRAHCSLIMPDGRIITTDLGFDLARVWTYVPGAGLALDHEIVLPFWTGPRHLVLHPSGNVFVVTEYSVQVVVLTIDLEAEYPTPSGLPRLSIAQISPAIARETRAFDSAAEIALSEDSRFLYVCVRGSNTITTLRVDNPGHVYPVADTPSGGDWPRHHLVLGNTLLIAHERSNQITLFNLDPETGLPTGPTQQLPVIAPTALLPAGR